MKHTSGPWETCDSNNNGRIWVVHPDSPDHGIAMCDTEANAILIASAPQLLEALQKIRAWALSYRCADDGTFEEDKDIPFGLAHDAICIAAGHIPDELPIG